jgi:UTP--glucose-1-phosphate uridylyltransferase
MIHVFEEKGGSVLATQTVEGPGISAYGVLAGSPDAGNPRIYNCTGMVEKPKFEDAPSKQAIIGRYVLTPRVFELLEQTTPGAGGEIQLTDGIKALLKEEKVFGYTFEGKRFDAGDKFGMLQATVEFALKRPEFGDKFREYLKGLEL